MIECGYSLIRNQDNTDPYHGCGVEFAFVNTVDKYGQIVWTTIRNLKRINAMEKNMGISKENLHKYIIKIDNGETFEGTVENFEECFFADPTFEDITYWCNKNDMKLEFILKKEFQIN